MKFARNDVTIFMDTDPEDRNDPEAAKSAIEYTIPEGFSDKAHAVWNYLEGAAFIFEYKGKLVVTDESLDLTVFGDGSREAPLGGPRFVCDSWEELEAWLDLVYDELRDNGLL